MSRDLPPLPPDDEEPGGPEQPAGHVRPTRPGTLLGFALAGLVLGSLVRPVTIRLNDVAPMVGWAPVLALFLAAAILAAVAWSTYRSLHPREGRFQPGPGIDPAHAVNRLVLAKASALVGALVTGGYLGYALSWLGVTESPLATQRMVQSLVAALGGVLIVAASLLLERACRIRGGDGADLT